MVRDSFAVMPMHGVAVHPIIPVKTPWNYRSKMEYVFGCNEAGKFQELGLLQERDEGQCCQSQRMLFDSSMVHGCNHMYKAMVGGCKDTSL